MKRKYLLCGMVYVLFLTPIISRAQTTDSNAVIKNSVTEEHIVARGETLYGIARKNNCTIEQIKKLNPGVNFNKLKYGLKINVPLKVETASVKPSINSGSARVKTLTETSVSSDVTGASGFFPVYHVIQQGETLLKIASQYHQKMATIRRWNHMSDNTIVIGKKMIVGRTSANSSTQTANAGSILSKHTATLDLVETTEKGIAECDTGISPNGMLYGLCSVVPEGSIVKVTNLSTQEIIMVKIIGKLPPNDDKDNVLIKIPATAARQLNAFNEKFVILLSYFAPPQLSLK